MTCQDARESLSDLLDEALEPDRRVEIDAHLASCADCRFELDRLRATVGALRGLDHPRAPAGFVERVVQRVHPTPWHRRLCAWLFLPLSVKLPVEVAAVAVIAGLAVLVWERTPELRDAARVESPAPSAPSTAAVEPAPSAPLPSPSPPASSPSKAPRARSAEPPRSSPAPVETEARPAREDKIASAPPASEVRSEREALEEPAPRPPAQAGSAAAQSERAEIRARSTPQAVRRMLAPASPPSDLAGRLIAGDRDAAATAVVELLAKLGGRETGRRQESADTVLDVQIPAARYDDFIRGLEALGSWTASGRPTILPLDPPQIRLTIRLTG